MCRCCVVALRLYSVGCGRLPLLGCRRECRERCRSRRLAAACIRCNGRHIAAGVGVVCAGRCRPCTNAAAVASRPLYDCSGTHFAGACVSSAPLCFSWQQRAILVRFVRACRHTRRAFFGRHPPSPQRMSSNSAVKPTRLRRAAYFRR